MKIVYFVGTSIPCKNLDLLLIQVHITKNGLIRRHFPVKFVKLKSIYPLKNLSLSLKKSTITITTNQIKKKKILKLMQKKGTRRVVYQTK